MKHEIPENVTFLTLADLWKAIEEKAIESRKAREEKYPDSAIELDYLTCEYDEDINFTLKSNDIRLWSRVERGGSEGIYLDFTLCYTEGADTVNLNFATIKTLDESPEALYKMALVAQDFQNALEEWVWDNNEELKRTGYRVPLYRREGLDLLKFEESFDDDLDIVRNYEGDFTVKFRAEWIDYFIEAHECDDGIDYTIYRPSGEVYDGGVLEDFDKTPGQVIADLILEENVFKGKKISKGVIIDTDIFEEALLSPVKLSSTYWGIDSFDKALYTMQCQFDAAYSTSCYSEVINNETGELWGFTPTELKTYIYTYKNGQLAV